MKHPFIKSAPKSDDREHFSDEIVCAICRRPEVDHGPEATCENCGKVADCDFHNRILVCNECAGISKEAAPAKKLDIIPGSLPLTPLPALEIERSTIEQLEQVRSELNDIDTSSQKIENKVHRENAYTTIKSSEDFFNAETEALVDLEKRIMNDESLGEQQERYFEFGRQVRARIMHFQEVIKQSIDIQLECASNQRADIVALNQLVSKLRTEYREKLHLESIDYIPVRPSNKVSVPRSKTSKTDKMIEQIATVMKMPVAQARIIYENQLKASGIVCTCKETPGICRVHQ